MNDSYFFSTKKIVNLDESAVGYSNGKIIVTNNYSSEVEYEYELEESILGIRGKDRIIEFGVIDDTHSGTVIELDIHFLASMDIVQSGTAAPVLSIQTSTSERKDFPLLDPLSVVIKQTVLIIRHPDL